MMKSERTKEGGRDMEKVIVVTGGTSGYGFAAAQKFLEAGERVIAVARNKEALEKTKESLGADIFAADITKEDDWAALYEYVNSQYGRIDLLLNNAGGAVVLAPFLEQSSEKIMESINLNLLGMIWGCKAFAQMMAAQRSGTIINIASVCATHAWPAYSVYAAAKSGVVSFSKSLYVELRPMGVRVCCLIPAAGDTPFCVNAGGDPNPVMMKAPDFAQAIFDVFNLPPHIVVENMTVWGMDQEVVPL
jgi:NAD(P)-dependent dehydrogenase (short-subunit alcohol dehydrogenase family)